MSQTTAIANNSSLVNPKMPPHSHEAEQAVLGGLMLNNQAWDQIAGNINSEDFYRKPHKIIFQALEKLAADHQPFDVLTLAENLKAIGQLSAVGGENYLFELANNTPSATNIKAYANIVREKSILRQLVQIAAGIADTAFFPEGRNSQELLDKAETEIFKIAELGLRKSEPVKLSKLLAQATERIDALYHADAPITGLSTGFADLDEITSGLQAGDLIIIAGRPSMGKTALAMNIAEHAAISADKPILIFSLEMPGEQLAMRMMSSLGRIDQNKVRTGKLSDDDWPRLTSAVSMLSEAKMFIDDTPGLSPMEIRSRARRVIREHGQLGLIIVDYLQLMQIPGNKENRTTEISEISRALKNIAKELNVPLIAGSQLNRSLESRHDRRPVMSDLRESGAIEQDADVIAFIYRDEVYNEDSPDKGIAEIIIGKQRNGPIGKVRLTFLGQYTRFENFMSEAYMVDRF